MEVEVEVGAWGRSGEGVEVGVVGGSGSSSDGGVGDSGADCRRSLVVARDLEDQQQEPTRDDL